MKSHSGFTLIELLVTLTIMGVIMLVSLPLTQTWVNNSAVTETKALLQQAYSRTRALALTNRAINIAGGAAAYLCISGSKMYVQVARTDGSLGTCGSSGYSWTGEMKSGITITTSAAATFSCMGLSNLGIPVSNTSTGVCTTDKVLTVTKGSESNAKALY